MGLFTFRRVVGLGFMLETTAARRLFLAIPSKHVQIWSASLPADTLRIFGPRASPKFAGFAGYLDVRFVFSLSLFGFDSERNTRGSTDKLSWYNHLGWAAEHKNKKNWRCKPKLR